MKVGRCCIGVGITFYDPTVTDALCDLLDFVWIDMEHNPLSLEAVQAHIIATQGSDVAAIVRVPSHDPAIIKTVLDIGADGIIVPNVRNAAEAADAVRACRYPPEGIRGYGPRRPSRYGQMEGAEFCKAANESVLAIAQIEHIDAVKDIENILQVPGLDSIVFGPNDLSGSMGFMGEPRRPEVVQAMEAVISKARGSGVYIGSGAGNPKDTEYWIKQGVAWLLFATDYALMRKAATEFVQSIRSIPMA
jgi:2-dehydro-3-deoxyglucarate aldolase/4-hydroxy-2-oxoheptanedioate aldolase